MASGPLAGIRVLEFTQIIAGPFACQHLADMGADVIKFEPIEGEPWRLIQELVPKESRPYASLNRGKRSISLDMNRAESRDVIHRMATDADVVVINYRPGVAEKLGIDYDTLSAINPRVVYCENTAFGRKGPLARRGGYDIVVQGLTGLMAGESKMEGAVPTYIYPAIADYATGIQMSNAICAALFHRERTGEGQRIDCTLMGTALAVQTSQFTWIDAWDEATLPPMLAEIAQARRDKQPFLKQLDIHNKYRPGASGNIYYRVYQTADGFVILGALSHALRVKVLSATGLKDSRFRADGSFDMFPPGWEEDGPKLVLEAEALFLSKGTDEWLAILEAAGVPSGPMLFVEELFDHPQTLENGLVVEIEHPALGHMRMVGPPFQMSRSPLAPQGPSPELGADTDALLASIGLSRASIDAMRDSGAIR
jgi:formyl-CoA transferase